MDRNKFLDSAKFILVFFVVLAHTGEYNLFYDGVKLRFYIFLSIFTMPLLIMISGYVSKSIHWGKYKKSFLQLLFVYITFQLLYSIHSIATGNFNLTTLLIPIGPLWYIAGLLFWRFLACIIVKFKIHFIWSISVSTSIALAIGFIQDSIPVSRILVFLPFFILGYYCPVNLPERIKKINKIYPILFFSILAVFVVIYSDPAAAFTVFGNYPYKDFLSLSHGFFLRVLFFLLAIISSVAAYNLIPDTFYKLGAVSLVILLLHILLVFPVYRSILHYCQVQMPLYIDFFVAIVITFLCILVARIKIIQYLINPVLLFKKLIN